MSNMLRCTIASSKVAACQNGMCPGHTCELESNFASDAPGGARHDGRATAARTKQPQTRRREFANDADGRMRQRHDGGRGGAALCTKQYRMHPRAASSTKLKSPLEDSTGVYPASSTASRPTAVAAVLAVVTHRARIVLLLFAHDLSAFAAASISCRRHAQTGTDNYGRAALARACSPALAAAASQKGKADGRGLHVARHLQSLHPRPEANRPRSALLLDHLLLPPEAHGAAADQPE